MRFMYAFGADPRGEGAEPIWQDFARPPRRDLCRAAGPTPSAAARRVERWLRGLVEST